MEIYMDFSKTTMGTNVGEFLGEHLTEPRDKESVRRFMRGNKLAYGEANHLIRSLLHSLIIQDGKEGKELVHPQQCPGAWCTVV